MAVRRARPDELAAINARYAAVDFVPSTPADLLVCAQGDDGAWVAQGRLVEVAAGVAELGGILVAPEARGRGLARAVVDALLTASPYPVLYCLPFAELEALYAGAGFTVCAPGQGMPEPVLRKFAWCNAHYGRPVLLMVRHAVAP